MNPITLAFGFIFISGIIGQISLSNSFRFLPAHRNIDHPSKTLRVYYRLMAIFMCQFWSFFLSTALLGALDLEEHLDWVRHSHEVEQAILMLVFPLPLMAVLYVLYAKFVRWAARRENAR